MKIKVLLIGYGSAGIKHAAAMERLIGKKNIFVYSNNSNHKYTRVNNLDSSIKLLFDYIIISSKTSDHLNQLKIVDKLFSNKKVLIEKPLSHKLINTKFKNNNYFIGYNLRYHPLFNDIKKAIQYKTIINVNINCFSYLPKWRNNYSSYSFFKKKGGGVHLDLSHEIDYLLWIFGDIKNLNSSLKKISEVTYDSMDFLNINGILKNKSYFQIILTYFSRIERRELYIDTNDSSIFVNFKNNSININGKIKTYKNFSISETFYLMHKDILKNKKNLKAANLIHAKKVQLILSKL
jgi:CMP-N,N'-diacetyllegionaminic acid synthase